ncbi:DUF2799 domain-containing protein [Parasalinivibrio latis]|uniref:DUF2799 domain-containing protein n=1 Tax=Parasalinivibrio latis TaxID=2952610 RepID=UPI0030DF7ED6
MLYRLKWLLAGSLILVVSGCSVMNEDECRTADWYSIGYQDGANGSDMANSLGDRSSACAEYNVRVNFDQYKEGYQHGIKAFCNEASGYYAASTGYVYQGICPANLEPAFLKGYKRGRKLFEIQQEVDQAKQALDQAKWDRDYKEDQIKRLKNKLVYDDLTPRQRQNILDELEQYQSTVTDISHLTIRYERAKQKLRDFESRHQY